MLVGHIYAYVRFMEIITGNNRMKGPGISHNSTFANVKAHLPFGCPLCKSVEEQ